MFTYLMTIENDNYIVGKGIVNICTHPLWSQGSHHFFSKVCFFNKKKIKKIKKKKNNRKSECNGQ